jgi:hypothetical protein
MAKIELEIVANNSQYIAQTKEVEQATQSMHNTVARGQQREKGLIEDLIDSIKELEESKKKAYSIESIEKYNKKLAEAKKDLKEYEQAGISVEKTNERQKSKTNELWGALKRLGAAYLTVSTAIKAFKAIMSSTQQTADLFKREISGLKEGLGELWRSIASGNMDELGKRMKEAREAGREYENTLDEIGDRERALMIRESERKIKLAELAKVYRNTALSHKEQADAAEKYIDLTIEGMNEAIELAQIRLDNELMIARQRSGLTDDEIMQNLSRAEYIEKNIDAVNKYREAISGLAAEQAKGKEVSISPEGIPIPIAVPDANLIAIYEQQIAGTSDEIKNLSEEMKGWNLIVDEQRKRITDAIVDINNKRAEATSSTIRANIKAEIVNRDAAEADKKAKDESLKRLDEFIKATAQLQDEYEQSQIENLEGLNKIEAERKYQLRQIELLRAHLESLGTLTDQHYIWLDGLISAANKKAELDRADYYKKEYEDAKQAKEKKQKLEDERIGYERELRETTLDLIDNNEREAIELKIQFAEEDIALLKKRGAKETDIRVRLLRMQIEALNKGLEEVIKEESTPSIWDMIGLGENKEAQDAIKEAIKAVTDSLDEIYDARVEDAKRTTDLLDEQIANTNDALANEIELAKAGYANNVSAKQKELDELKKQREKAYKDEQKAVKAQRMLDSITQLSNLVTASSKIFNSLSEAGPVGIAIAIATIAAMFTAFAVTKAKAAQATKLAKGGTGTVTGNLHSEGGERFGDHIEVERGEAWGVLSRPATKKYGKIFSEMVNSFNKGKLPAVSNNIIVDTDKTVHELVNVKGELVKINKYNAGQKEVHQLPGMRIERTGHKTRIIRNV